MESGIKIKESYYKNYEYDGLAKFKVLDDWND